MLILVVVVGILASAALWAFHNVGRWLAVSDALQPTRAIVVLTGRMPYRVLEAADGPTLALC